MKALKLITIMLLVMNLSINSFSQIGLTFNVMGALPLSDYGSGDIEDEDSGWSGLGFGLGVQYVYPLMPNGLGLFVGVDAIYSGVKKSTKDDIKELFESMAGAGVDFTWPKMFNIPLSAGLNFTFGTGEGMGAFVNAGLTYNFFKMTDFVAELDNEEETWKTELASSLGFKIGGGIILNEKISVFVNYLGLGEHDLTQTIASEDYDAKLKIDILTIGLGFRF